MRIDVDPNGNPWVVNDKGQVYFNSNNHWQGFSQAPKANDISVGGNGAVYIAGVDGSVYGLNRDKWVKFPMADKVVRLSVDQVGDVWAVTDRQKIFAFSR